MENSIKKYTKNQLHYHNSLMIKEKFPAFPVQSRSSRSSRLFKSLIGNDSFYTISTPYLHHNYTKGYYLTICESIRVSKFRLYLE